MPRPRKSEIEYAKARAKADATAAFLERRHELDKQKAELELQYTQRHEELTALIRDCDAKKPKSRREVTQRLRNYLDDKFGTFIDKMEQLSPRDFCRVYLDLMSYTEPKLQSVKVEDNGAKRNNSITEKLTKLVTIADNLKVKGK